MGDAKDPSSPVLALREAFGDRKLPDISRKITACVACRKQKIRCDMRNSQPPCTRCKKRGLPCTVNRSLQMLLESDTVWKHSMEKKVRKLEAIVSKLANDTMSPEVIQQLAERAPRPGPQSPSVADVERRHLSRNESQATNHWDIVMDLESGPGAIPGFYVSDTPSTQPENQVDFISRGVISLERARAHFQKYKNRLDHFPYRILGDHDPPTLESVRAASPLLAAAVCAVGALHTASEDFDLCYKEFASLCAMQTLSKESTVDDVRALCIGAFWLSDLSWALVGTAVRIATELQLHKSYSKAMQGDRQHYLRARLWYLVYACDHHFSVAYGKPPMTRECEAVRNVRNFVDCKYSTEDDARLASQVLRWSICSNIFDTFGVEVDRPLSDAQVPCLQRFSLALDNIRAEWIDRFSPNAHVGNYPRKGVTLQYHFAKLYLCSHAYRGLGAGRTTSRSPDVSRDLDEAANTAVFAAISILRAVVSDTEIQSYLDGLPIYFNVMIAFAAVFLLKVSTKFSTSVQINVQEVKQLMTTLVATLKRITSTMHPRHLLVSITRGIDSLLQRCGLAEDPSPMMQMGQSQLVCHSETLNGDFDWITDQAFDPLFMGEYDILLDQDMAFDLPFPPDSNPLQP